MVVTFGEAMDITATPNILFGQTVSSTLTFTGGVWSSGDTVYTASYSIADANETLTNVTIDVENALDAVGNAQQDYTPVAEFSIDTLNPTVTGVAFSQTTITDDPITTPFTVAVTFSEAMDSSVAPSLSFTQDVSSTLTFTSGSWSSGNTVYTASYAVADGNAIASNVTLQVDGAQDAAGNAQQAHTSTESFSISTFNPSVTDVSVSDTQITDADVGATFSVAVTFDAAMNTSVSPTLVFGQTVSSTLTFTSGAWSSGNTIYTATYDVADGNETLTNVTIDVENALDAAGNPQQDYTPVAEFSVDTQNPTVADLSVSNLIITDATASAGTFTVAVTFNEAMNTGAAPSLSFDQDVSSTLTFTSGVWSNGNTVYTASYAVTDSNVVTVGIDITVTGAQDALGNTQVASTSLDAFSINTVNPEVSGVSVSDMTISDATAGVGTFTVTVVFDGAMRTVTNPMITFSDDLSSTLNFTSGAWSATNTANDTYTATYSVSDANTESTEIDITVSGARNADGNLQAPSTTTGVFDVDTLNPTVTSVSVSAATVTDATAASGTFTIAVTFSEAMNTSASPALTFSPDLSTTLTLTGGTWSAGNTIYTASYSVTDSNVDFDSINVQVSSAADAASNTQSPFTASGAFGVDTENPTVSSVNVPPGTVAVVQNGDVTITFGEPVNVTGIGDFQLTVVDAGSTTNIDLSTATFSTTDNITFSFDLSAVTTRDGTYTLSPTTSITDDNGNPLTAGRTADFTMNLNPDVTSVAVQIDQTTTTLTDPASGATVVAVEGQTVKFTIDFTDANESNFSYEVDLGGGGLLTNSLTNDGPFEVELPFLDQGTYAVQINVDDNLNDGGEEVWEFDLQVDNAPPTLTFLGTNSVAEGDTLSFDKAFQITDFGSTQKGSGDFTGLNIEWDVTGTGGGIPLSSNTTPAVLTTSFANNITTALMEGNLDVLGFSPGTFTIRASVTDDDSATTTLEVVVTVTDVEGFSLEMTTVEIPTTILTNNNNDTTQLTQQVFTTTAALLSQTAFAGPGGGNPGSSDSDSEADALLQVDEMNGLNGAFKRNVLTDQIATEQLDAALFVLANQPPGVYRLTATAEDGTSEQIWVELTEANRDQLESVLKGLLSGLRNREDDFDDDLDLIPPPTFAALPAEGDIQEASDNQQETTEAEEDQQAQNEQTQNPETLPQQAAEVEHQAADNNLGAAELRSRDALFAALPDQLGTTWDALSDFDGHRNGNIPAETSTADQPWQEDQLNSRPSEDPDPTSPTIGAVGALVVAAGLVAKTTNASNSARGGPLRQAG